MARIVINSTVEPHWQSIIEAKLQLMLGSLLTNVSRIDVELGKVIRREDMLSTYTIVLVLTQHNGESYSLRNDQPDANAAIEGVIARARRAITRISRRSGSS